MVLALGATSDYSYFDQKALKNWAGPSHWKVKPKAAGLPAVMVTLGLTGCALDTKATTSQTKKKAPKEKFFLDFSKEFDVEKAFRRSTMPHNFIAADLSQHEPPLHCPRQPQPRLSKISSPSMSIFLSMSSHHCSTNQIGRCDRG